MDLRPEDNQIDPKEVENFDNEYIYAAVPIITELPEETGTDEKTRSRRKLNGYARQTANPDNWQWDWDGFEFVHVRLKGKCVRSTADLYPGYRFPCGGWLISLMEGNYYRRCPGRLGGRLHEYLISYHREKSAAT